RPRRSRDPRCFEPFIDLIDGVVCVSAEVTADELAEQLSPHGWRFPLLSDRDAPLREQVAASGFAAASSRFGPLCDNIVGMNWRLPDDNVIRLGERVVKTTTGYDLFRFMLATTGRFGSPVDYVLRLRIDSGPTKTRLLSGPFADLATAISAMMQSCWMHWFDAVDLIADSSTERLRVAINCPDAEWTLAESFLASVAAAHDLTMSPVADGVFFDGRPDIAFKTTPECVVELAREVAGSGAFTCVASCATGAVNAYLLDRQHGSNVEMSNDDLDRIRQLVESCEQALHERGGDWRSRHLPPPPLADAEREWVGVLEREFGG
ncbi:MAG: hypothetical protein QF805_22505, partial [Pirellulaceae bacterium]|nr:hypothetical protein [Pirellulaceae bacterium]